MANFKKPKRYDSFKMDLDLMELIRRFAKQDSKRSIKSTIDMIMREGFKARGFDAKV